MAGNVKLMTSAGGGVVLDTATTTATDVTVKVPVTGVNNGTLVCSDSSGNVGIGTSLPTAKFTVSGNISFPEKTAAYIGVDVATLSGNGGDFTVKAGGGSGAGNVSGNLFLATGRGGASASSGYTAFGRSHATNIGGIDIEYMRLDSSGNLLVGTTTPGAVGCSIYPAGYYRSTRSGTAFAYHMVFANGNGDIGSINSTGSTTTYSTSSDYRLKEDVQPMQNALDSVLKLNPVTYKWKVDGSDGQGFIAHELQAVVPDCVTGEKDAVDAEGNPVYQGIDTSFLSATLTKAIQELNEKVEAQAAEIAALKGAA